ncbi:MAG: hypothetical protein ACI9K5_003378, partial [Gammaproteobacteria bacterium]
DLDEEALTPRHSPTRAVAQRIVAQGVFRNEDRAKGGYCMELEMEGVSSLPSSSRFPHSLRGLPGLIRAHSG